MNELRFNKEESGQSYLRVPLSGDVLKFATDKRCELIDLLSGYDDVLADEVINNESLENIDVASVDLAIRKLTLSQAVVPVLLGSAYKNTGIQLLMNSIVSHLPAPSDRNTVYRCFGYILKKVINVFWIDEL